MRTFLRSILLLSCVSSCLLICSSGCGGESPGTGNSPREAPRTPDGGAGGGGTSGAGGGESGAGGGAGGAVSIGVDRQALSGTRLKVRSYKGEDGSEVFATMFDTQRSEECAFVLASDGQLRCLTTGANTAYASGYFSDAACASPVFFNSCAGGGATVGLQSSDTCPYRTIAYSLSPGAPTSAYVRSGTTCMATTFTATPNFSYYQSGGVIPPSAFVRAAVVTQP